MQQQHDTPISVPQRRNNMHAWRGAPTSRTLSATEAGFFFHLFGPI